MPVCTPLGQGLSAQLPVEEGNGKPPHHHPSSHFPSLDDAGVSPLSVITDLPYGRALIIIMVRKIQTLKLKYFGHVERMRAERLPHVAMLDWIDEKRGRGRPRKRWIESLDCIEENCK